MADLRDYRVRANLFFDKEGVARGLFNHVKGVEPDAVDINPSQPNAEMRYVKIENHYIVMFDLCFPPDCQEEAEGLFIHSVNTPSKKSPEEDICYVSLERCGHRQGVSCEITDKYIVE